MSAPWALAIISAALLFLAYADDAPAEPPELEMPAVLRARRSWGELGHWNLGRAEKDATDCEITITNDHLLSFLHLDSRWCSQAERS
jgi:hypothetical protein